MVLVTIQVTVLFIMPFNFEKKRNEDQDHISLINLRAKNRLIERLGKNNATKM